MPLNAVVSVMSRDRTGIIADITKPILEMGGNVSALSQTVLRGYFTIILTVDFPDDVPVEAVREKVGEASRRGAFSVSVQVRDPQAATVDVVEGGEGFVLTINGKDEPGIINRISSYLSSRQINVVDLYAEAHEGEFMMISQVIVAPGQDIGQVHIDLETMWRESNIHVTLQHQNIFAAINEVDFRHNRRST